MSDQQSPPPVPKSAPPISQPRKRSGCGKGCLIAGGIGLILFVLLGFFGYFLGNVMERQGKADLESADALWLEEKRAEASSIYMRQFDYVAKANRPKVYERIITHLYDSGDRDGATVYCNKAIDDDLTVEFSRDDLERVFAEARRAIEDRKAAELAKQRADEQRQAKADEFVTNGKGKKVPFQKWGVYGNPVGLDGTNNEYWVAYLPKIDVSFVSEKATDKVVFVGHGKGAATDYLAKKDAARETRLSVGFSSWDGSHLGLTEIIKKSMNDPKSYEHVETTYRDMGDHLVVMTTFRGKNAFGGVVKNSVKAKTDLDGNVLKVIEEDR